MAQKILSQDWSDYNARKNDSEDPRFFDSSKAWEMEYLAKKIKQVYPLHNDAVIHGTLKKCARYMPAPCPRFTFVNCLMNMLQNEPMEHISRRIESRKAG